MTITAGSHSRLVVFETCKRRAWFMYDQKIPEPERPLPPGKTEHANDRGTRVHTAAEEFIKDNGPFIPEMTAFETEFGRLQDLYPFGGVQLEGEWAHDRNWQPVDWRDPKAFLRLKLDCLVHLNEQAAVAIDFKTGKKSGNEIKHADQLLLYALCTFLRYPELKTVYGELWYLDKDEITSTVFTRSRTIKAMNEYDRRLKALTECQDFRASPSIFSCRFCGYGPDGLGLCEDGLTFKDGRPHKIHSLKVNFGG